MAALSDMVKDICTGRQDWKLKVRVLRLWNVCPNDEPKKPIAVEMVLVDALGTKIQACIRKPMMRKFKDAIVEGLTYKMSFFGVICNTGAYKAASHEFKLLFHYKTRVMSIESPSIPIFGLTLMNTADIMKTQGDSDLLIVTRVSVERVSVRDGRTTRLIILELSDERGKVQCALFGDYVDFINEKLDLFVDELPFVIIQFAKIKAYKEMIGIQNVLNTSKIHWNPQIPETSEFKQRLVDVGFQLNVPVGVIQSGFRGILAKEDFIDSYPRKTLNELHCCEEDGIFIVRATIIGTLKADKWWYLSCTCHRAVSDNEGVYHCGNCKADVQDVIHRYKIKVEVYDGYDSAAFVLFDADIRHLLNISCGTLVEEAKSGSAKGELPKVFETLHGREMLFKVEKTSDYAFGYDDSFKVKKICDDMDVMKLFIDQSSVKTPEKSKMQAQFTGAGGEPEVDLDAPMDEENIVTLTDGGPMPSEADEGSLTIICTDEDAKLINGA